jgi:hypothetical protein
MKKFICLALISGSLFTAIRADAQFMRIPGPVTDSFKVRYPSAQGVTWEDKISAFQASFNMDSSKYQARFDSKGKWIGAEKKINKEELPASVKDGLSKSKYADWQVGSARCNYLPGGVIQYSILVSKSDLQKKSLLFSSEGQLLKDSSTL